MEWSAFKLNEQGLLPIVVQDVVSKQVLMLAYTNQAAFEETVASGEMVYYSRSRQERWKKGETSGNTQKVKGLSMDCDKDTLLAQVEQNGVACHTGNYSCFDGGTIIELAGYKDNSMSILNNLEQKDKEIKILQKKVQKLEKNIFIKMKYQFKKIFK